MNTTTALRDAAAQAMVFYTSGEPRAAAQVLRDIAAKIEAETDAYEADRFDDDGLLDHQRARTQA